MKKVRLFAVAAAMGMFASTVAAAETTTTGYVSTWGDVTEIIKVDLGNKVVAPTATIKVVKETRTTDIEDALDSDYLGLDLEVPCYVGNTDVVGTDDNEDSYTDHQIYFINGEEGYYTSVEEAVRAWGLTDGNLVSGKFLAPGTKEAKEGTYVAKYANKHFADWEEVIAFAEEEGFVSYVYDKDGEVTDVILNETVVSDEDGNVEGTVATKLTLNNSKYAEEETKKAVVNALVGGYAELETQTYWTLSTVAKKNYNATTYGSDLNYTLDTEDLDADYPIACGTTLTVAEYNVLVVEEDRYGDYVPVTISKAGSVNISKAYKNANKGSLNLSTDKITVIVREEADREFKTATGNDYYYNTLMTIDPVHGKKWEAESKMVWNIEAGSFVKEEIGYDTYSEDLVGFWWNHVVDHDDDLDENPQTFYVNDTKTVFTKPVLGLEVLPAAIENDSDKIVITGVTPVITSLNTKTEKMTVKYGTENKELTIDAVKIDGSWYPAVSNEAELVKVVAKLANIGTFKMDKNHQGLTKDYIKYLEGDMLETELETEDYNDYSTWYEKTETLAKNPWSGFTFEGELPYNELRGADAKACTYKVADGEEVEATITSDADSVDTSVAGVKTLTLTAKVGDEVVSTKEVKVVVAPRYERQYVNGKVAVLKAYYAKAEKVLYSEYHYDWTAGTYTATFYAEDGVTVASTANGTL